MFYAVNTSRVIPVDEGDPSNVFKLPTFIVEAENETMARALGEQIADTFCPIEVASIVPAFVIAGDSFEARFRMIEPDPPIVPVLSVGSPAPYPPPPPPPNQLLVDRAEGITAK